MREGLYFLYTKWLYIKYMLERYTDNTHNSFIEKLYPGELREPSYGSINLDLESKTLSGEKEQNIHLSEKEYQILWLLVRAQGGMISRFEIETFIYEDLPDDKDITLSNTVEVFMFRIRKKLELVTNNAKITNIRNIGFRVSNRGDQDFELEVDADLEK
jgi:DNA-binding response OmpR family regulator